MVVDSPFMWEVVVGISFMWRMVVGSSLMMGMVMGNSFMQGMVIMLNVYEGIVVVSSSMWGIVVGNILNCMSRVVVTSFFHCSVGGLVDVFCSLVWRLVVDNDKFPFG